MPILPSTCNQHFCTRRLEQGRRAKRPDHDRIRGQGAWSRPEASINDELTTEHSGLVPPGIRWDHVNADYGNLRAVPTFARLGGASFAIYLLHRVLAARRASGRGAKVLSHAPLSAPAR